MSDSLQPPGLQPTRLLCSWDSPGKNTGGGCHFLLQGSFPTQGWNLSLFPWQADSLPLRTREALSLAVSEHLTGKRLGLEITPASRRHPFSRPCPLGQQLRSPAGGLRVRCVTQGRPSTPLEAASLFHSHLRLRSNAQPVSVML